MTDTGAVADIPPRPRRTGRRLIALVVLALVLAAVGLLALASSFTYYDAFTGDAMERCEGADYYGEVLAADRQWFPPALKVHDWVDLECRVPTV